jgi:hypothetical protein
MTPVSASRGEPPGIMVIDRGRINSINHHRGFQGLRGSYYDTAQREEVSYE